MEYKSKSRRSRQAGDSLLRVNRQGLTAQRSLSPDFSVRRAPLLPTPHVSPRQLHLQRTEKQLTDFTLSPLVAQRQALAPMLEGLHLQRELLSSQGPVSQRQSLQRQIGEHQTLLNSPRLQVGQYEVAVQRQADLHTPVVPLTQRPQSPAQWSQGGLWEVQRVADAGKPGQTISLREQEQSQHLGVLRTVGTQLGQGFRTDTGPAVQRYAEYGAALAPFQRLGTGTGRAVVTTALMQVPASQRQALQRAIDETIQRQQAQESQDRAIIGLHSLQRQLEHLDGQGEQPLMERIQARRGSGNPIPASLRKVLELELNHDLSRVRLHDDAEADTLAKKVNAVAFTTGQDIFFKAGTFNPNTRTGVELIAHEIKHTKQQAQGTAKPGIDGDAGQEHDARSFGSQFAAKVDLEALAGMGHKATPTNAQRGRVSKTPSMASATGTLATSHLVSGRLAASPLQRLAATPLQRRQDVPDQTRVNSAQAGERGYVTAEQGVRLFSAPHQVSDSSRRALPIIVRGTVLRLLEHKEGWYKVSSPSGVGYVEGQFIKPLEAGKRGLADATRDPGASVHRAKSGDTLLGMVKRHFGLSADKETFKKRGQDMRYFANVIVSSNKPEAFKDNPSLVQRLYGFTVPGGDVLGKELIADTDYLIPSYGFALAQTKNVASGSLSAELSKLVQHMARFTHDYGTVKSIAKQKYYGPGIKRAVLDAPAQLLEGLIQFAILSGGVLALTTGIGAAVGALAGGVGAAPGAALGFEAGLALLNYVGIGFLVVLVGKQLGAFGGSLMQALKLTWDAEGSPAQLDKAAKALSDALEMLVSVLVQALIAYIAKAGLVKLGKTPFGRQIGLAIRESPAGKWLSGRGQSAKTLPEQKSETTGAAGTRPKRIPRSPAQQAYRRNSSAARRTKYEYTPKTRSGTQLQQDVSPALRTGETTVQAQRRMQLALREIAVRQKVPTTKNPSQTPSREAMRLAKTKQKNTKRPNKNPGGSYIDNMLDKYGIKVKGDFPETAKPDSILFRTDAKGNVTYYATYDNFGRIVSRVDINPLSAPHNGTPPPHAVFYHYVTRQTPNGPIQNRITSSGKEAIDVKTMPDFIPTRKR